MAASEMSFKLFNACLHGDKTTVHEMITSGVPDINWRHPDHDWTFLHIAAFSGSVPIVNLLLSAGADINIKDSENNTTVLHMASISGNVSLVKLLVDKEPSLLTEKTKKNGRSVLQLACETGKMDVVDYLINEKGVSLLDKSDDNLTVLHTACLIGSMPLVKLLADKEPCLLTEKTNQNENVLHGACQSGNLKVVQYLINEKRVSPLDKSKDGWTCLHWACKSGFYAVIEYLLRTTSLTLNDTGKNGVTPVDLLNAKDPRVNQVIKRKQECLRQLKANGYYNDDSSQGQVNVRLLEMLSELTDQDIFLNISSDNLTLTNIFKLLQDKSAQWDSIGRAFGVSLDYREELRRDIALTNESRLERVINKWLESAPSSEPLTWSDFKGILSDLHFNDTVLKVQEFFYKRQ